MSVVETDLEDSHGLWPEEYLDQLVDHESFTNCPEASPENKFGTDEVSGDVNPISKGREAYSNRKHVN